MGFVGKGQRQRSVALPSQALEVVRHYLASRNGDGHHPEAPLIRKEDGSGEALSYYVINRVVTRWTRRHLGMRLTPHKLRHANGKHCVDRGVDIRVFAEALGHESLESTKIYTQVSFERTRRIAESSGLPGVQVIRCEHSRRINRLVQCPVNSIPPLGVPAGKVSVEP
jgi:site-specific recombinase XerC